METYYGPNGSRTCANPIYRPRSERVTVLPDACYTKPTQPEITRMDEREGVHLVTMRQWTYTTGLPELTNRDIKPLNICRSAMDSGEVDLSYRAARGVANVVFTPIYRVDAFLKGVATLRHVPVDGHDNGPGSEYTSDEWRAMVESADPNDVSFVGTPETDGIGFPGDHDDNNDAIPNSRYVFNDIVPSGLLKRWEKLPGAVQRYWIGYVFITYDTMFNERSSEHRLAALVGKLFSVSPRSVVRYAEFTRKCIRNGGSIPGAKSFRVPHSELPTGGILNTECLSFSRLWQLRAPKQFRAPWDTLDGERTYAEWGMDGPTDMAYAQRRASLPSH